MIAYIFKSSLSLIILFGLYWFLLRKEKLFVFNRIFLITSVVFSLVVPFISIPVNFQVAPPLNYLIPAPTNVLPEISIADNIVTSDTNISQVSPVMHASVIKIPAILLVLYFSGVILFLIRFLRNLLLIIRRNILSEKISFKGYRIVLINDKTSPCCFFKSIFLNRDDYLGGKIDKDLIEHELEHARQSHTIDIILIELVKIFYWFNPVHVLYDRAIRINHEYLADNGVINDNHDIKSYAEKLLNFITGRSNMSLTSGSNHSFTKNRLLMMTKTKSKRAVYGLRITIALSSILIFSLLISFKQSNKQPSNKDTDLIENTDLQTHTVKDIDGNVYNTVTIGTQIWMKENLKTTKYNDGTAIPKIEIDKTWETSANGAYCDYENTPSNSTTYGRLYNWYVIDNNSATKVSSNGGKNVCPAGWHVPSNSEWSTLITYLGGDSVAGGVLKETGSTHWVDPNWGASNQSGFTALPGGGRYPDGRFSRLWDEGHWWSATQLSYPPAEKNSTLAWFNTLSYANVNVSRDNGTKNCGFSVRCLIDNIGTIPVHEKPELFPIKKGEYSGSPSTYFREIKIDPITKEGVVHYGIDINASLGTVVMATAGGTVIETSWDDKYGRTILIDHGDGYQSLYAHLNDFNVKPGDSVIKGQTIGRVGTSGISTGPHLHFEILKNGDRVNPMTYLK
jgi:uncharacterized protein (TIGR02145 family)